MNPPPTFPTHFVLCCCFFATLSPSPYTVCHVLFFFAYSPAFLSRSYFEKSNCVGFPPEKKAGFPSRPFYTLLNTQMCVYKCFSFSFTCFIFLSFFFGSS